MGWFGRHWRGVVVAPLILWQIIRSAVRIAGDADVVLSRISEPVWVRTGVAISPVSNFQLSIATRRFPNVETLSC
jgi:hypothetical protein